MSTKTSADVLIGGKIYTLSGYESETYLQQVAAYINSKLNEFDEMEIYRRYPPDMKAALMELNIADDYFKAKEKAEQLSADLETREKEIYGIKHELISLKMKLDDREKEAKRMEKDFNELKLLKSRLEASLEEALLGKIKGSANAKEIEPKVIHKAAIEANRVSSVHEVQMAGESYKEEGGHAADHAVPTEKPLVTGHAVPVEKPLITGRAVPVEKPFVTGHAVSVEKPLAAGNAASAEKLPIEEATVMEAEKKKPGSTRKKNRKNRR